MVGLIRIGMRLKFPVSTCLVWGVFYCQLDKLYANILMAWDACTDNGQWLNVLFLVSSEYVLNESPKYNILCLTVGYWPAGRGKLKRKGNTAVYTDVFLKKCTFRHS